METIFCSDKIFKGFKGVKQDSYVILTKGMKAHITLNYKDFPTAYRTNRGGFPAMPRGRIQPVIIQVTCKIIIRKKKCNGFKVENVSL